MKRVLFALLLLAGFAQGQVLFQVSSAPPPSQAGTPTFSPTAGTYSGTQTITLSSPTSVCNSSIYWNTTGSPTLSDTHSTSASVAVTSTLYAKVIGCSGYSDSAVGSAAYTITVPGSGSDDFNRADGPLGSNWTKVTGTANMAVVSNRGAGATSWGGDAWVIYTGRTFSSNQYAEAKMYPSNSVAVAISVRASASTPMTDCRVSCTNTTCTGRYFNAGAIVNSSDSFTIASGDTIRIEVTGTTATVKKNGTTQGSPFTCSASSGNPGFFSNDSAVPRPAIDDFVSGDL